MVEVSEHGDAHDGDGDGGTATWRARGKASEGERARNGWSSDVASPLTPPLPNQPGQLQHMATTWRARPVASGPLARAAKADSDLRSVTDGTISSTSIS